ncbi:isocitrate lyase/PEP mutase family protein [Actinokineospora diospyrosa]|uniref:2-Methylisocitrate lyase, PEP mutase family n=1 Tax=Actinokineospora diospyrosa TaxID=103728 RepID=A0ABT1INA7_9PSEU|nr:isocitrate lyase/phosphoenolpyruvate mutase family protein [Actinokineospora diospyrosa]MCP2274155.1 2-Methylisocitrate lyase, PEP mutase family [Actinokineospora diospyrosa]
MDSIQRGRAETLRALHDGTLVLPNAWDAASAAVIAQAGATAIATTSGGVAWSAGRPDGHGLTREGLAELIGRIVRVVDVPVTADIEGGYGESPEDVAATVRAMVAAGAVGVNLEDSIAPGGPLHAAAAQAERVRAARAEAVAAGLPELWINVRTDVYLFGIGPAEGRLADVLTRAEAYAAAGADSLFVPGLVDLEVLAELVAASPLPINVMVWPGAPTVAELEAVGVRRVSVGTAIAQSAYAVAAAATTELLGKGTYDALVGGLDYGALNSAVTR